MAALALRNEERIGLGVAIGAHAALVALIVLRPPTRSVIPPPERMTVTIADEVGLTSAAPVPAADAAPDVAPELGEPAPPGPQAPIVQPEPPPPRPQPRAAPAPQPRPLPRAVPSPRPAPRATPSSQPLPQPSARPNQRQAQPSPSRQPQRNQPGASRIGSDFLKGAGGSGQSRTPPAQITGAVRSSLLGAISRKVRPHWQGKVPEGADAEKLVTILRWNLNRDGSLAGAVEVVSQEGQTDANRPQWARHREQAIRAVQLAAPFDLPDEFYDAWKRVGPIRFDKRLAQ